MLHWLAVVAFAEEPGFYPNAGPERIPLDADGTVRGLRRTGEVLVRADDAAALAALPEVASISPLRGGVFRIAPGRGVSDLALAVAVRGQPGVRWAHPDLVVPTRPAALPDDPYVSDQWHLENTGQQGFTPGVDIGASEAWGVTRGAGQLVAILDSGVDVEHPDLRVVDGFDYVDDDATSDALGDDAHGTACAGLAVGIGDNGLGTSGVAYEATAYGIRMIGASTLSDLYGAFVEAVDAGATVLSNSWGFENDCYGVSDYGVIADAFEYAEVEGRGGLGSAVVFAVGNGNCDITDNAMLANPTVIGVAAVSGFDVRESYSSFGPWVNLSAPSGGMYTTDILGSAGYNGYPGDDDYTTGFNGTSASTPVVAGVLALMFSANDRLTAADARDVLCDTAVRIDLAGGGWDATGWSPLYGCGRVHAGAAVLAVANVGPPATPSPGDPGELADDAAVLTWSAAADPDGDYVLHTVRWRTGSGAWTLAETDRAWHDLTGEVAAGDVVTWQVRAADLWGETDWSPEVAAAIVAPEPPSEPAEAEPASGCAHAPGASAAGLLIAGLAVGARRRRTSPSVLRTRGSADRHVLSALGRR